MSLLTVKKISVSQEVKSYQEILVTEAELAENTVLGKNTRTGH